MKKSPHRECGPGEVVVPRHCRAVSARSHRSSDNAQLRASLAELDAFNDLEPARPSQKAKAALYTLIRTLDRTPGFIVSAVNGMKALRGKVPDVETRYKDVTRAIRAKRYEDEDGFLGKSKNVKRAVFTMLLK